MAYTLVIIKIRFENHNFNFAFPSLNVVKRSQTFSSDLGNACKRRLRQLRMTRIAYLLGHFNQR
jgi:hypothetical protein